MRKKEIEENSFVGLQMTKHDALAGLDKIVGKKAKKDALKLQINFCKKVLGQTSDDQTLFQFSHNCKVFTDTQLLQNLCKLLLNYDHQTLTFTDVQRNPELLIYRRIQYVGHQFNSDGWLVWYKGTVLRETKEFRIFCDKKKNIHFLY